MRSLFFEWARWGFQRIPAWLFRWRPFTVYEIHLESTQPIDAEPNDDLRIRWVTATDHPKCDSLSPSHLFNRIGGGYSALVAERGEEPVGIVWFSTAPFTETELGISFEFGPNDVWLFAAHVLAEHRKTGVYSRLLSHALNGYSQKNFHRILLATTHGNVASLRAHEKFGAMPLGTVTAARIGSTFSLASCSGRIKRLSASLAFGRDATVPLRIR